MTMVHKRCAEFVKITKYKNNCVYASDETLSSAYEKAMNGYDNGVIGMKQLMPGCTDMETWLDYYFFCFLLYRHCK